MVAMITAALMLFSCTNEDDNKNDNATDNTGEIHPANEGCLPGLFSISADKQVSFSKGNLQYTTVGSHAVAGGGTAQGTWRFAENQWDTIGALNANVSSTYTGWIDLFCWGTSGYHDNNDPYNVHYYPYSTSTDSLFPDYNIFGYGPSTNMPDPNLVGTSANYDWGVYNAISNGGNKPGLWRTLSHEEWSYLLISRSGAEQKWGIGSVDGIVGLILLPDEWTMPEGLSFTAGFQSQSSNVFDKQQWSQFDTAGAVFLPAAGWRTDNEFGGMGECIDYQTSSYLTVYEDVHAYGAYTMEFEFENSHWSMLDGGYYRYGAFAVRLVKDVKNK